MNAALNYGVSNRVSNAQIVLWPVSMSYDSDSDSDMLLQYVCD